MGQGGGLAMDIYSCDPTPGPINLQNVVNMDLSPAFMLTHLNRFDWLSYNWQLKEDSTPFFIKYGYIWFYSGFPNRADRENLMQQTWDLIKQNYE